MIRQHCREELLGILIWKKKRHFLHLYISPSFIHELQTLIGNVDMNLTLTVEQYYLHT